MKPLSPTPYEVLSLWALLHLVFLSVPVFSAFLIRSRGRLHLWHHLVGIPILAVIIAAAAPCLGLLSRPGAFLLLVELLWRSKFTVLISLMVSCGLISLIMRKGDATRGG